jgi:hypothetical protein
MGIKNAHNAINNENMTHVDREVFDPKNLRKHNFSNAHNLRIFG